MYLGQISGYGTSDFNKALKGTNVAAIQKGLDFQRKQLAKRKPKDTKGIANDMAQIAAAESRLAQLQVDPSSKAILTAAPVPVSIAPAPPPVQQAPVSASPVPQVAPPAPSVAPSPASEALTPPITPPPSQLYPLLPSLQPSPGTFFPPSPSSPSTSQLVPSVLDSPSAAAGQTPAPVAPANESKMPMILGAGALGLLALFFLNKKKGR